MFERLCQSPDKQPWAIRRWLTEGAVRAADKRAQFIGVEAYEEAGGQVLRDLFQGDDGGWLQDAGLVDRLVAEKLRDAVEVVTAEGWKWVEAAPELLYGHAFGLRQLRGDAVPMSAEEEATCTALRQEMEAIEAASAEAEELTDAQDLRLSEIECALGALTERPVLFDPAEVARAGAFVSIGRSGELLVERGFVRPEDEALAARDPEPSVGEAEEARSDAGDAVGRGGTMIIPATPPSEPDEDEGLKPLSDRLVLELTAFRTVALRHALGERPEVAFLAALHGLCLQVFYAYALDSSLDLALKSVGFAVQGPGLKESPAAMALEARQDGWRARLPKAPEALWDALAEFDGDARQTLFAHCVAQSVNAVVESFNRRPRAVAHADRLAQALELDMAAAGWTPTVEAFLGRVTKARILGAVTEARGARAAARIDHLKKGEMAEQAEVLLADSGWLPELLRTPGRALPTVAAFVDVEVPASDGGDPAVVAAKEPFEDELADIDAVAIAAE